LPGSTSRPTHSAIRARGTPLIEAAPTAGIDLPLKVLIWEDAKGRVAVGYNSPAWIGARHGVPEELRTRLQAVEQLAAIAAGAAPK
jgi:uncharacterized protein (DUF302 family)